MAAELKQVNGSKGNGKAPEPYAVKRGPGWKVREAAKNVFVCIVGNDVKPEDVKGRDFFSLVAKDLRALDTIEVYTEDHRYFVECLVLDAGMGWAEVTVLRQQELPKVTGADPDKLVGFDFERDGVSGYWYGVRKKDGAVLGKHHNLRSLQDAKRFVEDHASTRAQ